MRKGEYGKLRAKWAERRERILSLLEQGVTRQDVCRRYRITKQRLSQIVNAR